jgi:hypothetical protein
MRKRKEYDYFDEEGEGGDYNKDFSGAGVTEFGLDLNTYQLRNLSPEELEKYLHREARRRWNER